MNEEALQWVIRTRDPAFTDWEGFTLWLERDPGHAAAYDAMMQADEELPAMLPPRPLLEAANDAGVPRRSMMRWIGGGAVAAALVAALSLGLTNRADIYSISTRPGETRSIALADGTRIELNGGTSLRLDRNNARFAALDRGEASFTVRHDAADPFRVTVGDAVFEDAGTVFNIVHSGTATRIGVSEGEVIYNPEAEAIALPAGRALADDPQGLRVMDIAPAAVGSWRGGRLIYANAPVAQIGEDIARSIGVPVSMTPGAAVQRFTGTIQIDKDPVRFFAGTAPLLGLAAVRQGDGWLLKEADGPQS